MIRITLVFVFAVALAAGCKSSDDAGGDDERGLAMSSDSAACKQAMACCEKRVELEKGEATPEDINLSCSGVAMAKTDELCEEFKQGYVVALEAAGKELPAECK